MCNRSRNKWEYTYDDSNRSSVVSDSANSKQDGGLHTVPDIHGATVVNPPISVIDITDKPISMIGNSAVKQTGECDAIFMVCKRRSKPVFVCSLLMVS